MNIVVGVAVSGYTFHQLLNNGYDLDTLVEVVVEEEVDEDTSILTY